MTTRLLSWRLRGSLRSCLTSGKCMYTFFFFMHSNEEMIGSVVCLWQRGCASLHVKWDITLGQLFYVLHISDSEGSTHETK